VLRLLISIIAVSAASVSGCGGSDPKPEGTGGTGGGAPGEDGGGGAGGTGQGDGGDTYDAPPIPGTIPLQMAPALVAGVVCEKLYTCCQPSEGLRPVTMTQPTCDALVGATLGVPVAQANTAIVAGRAMYDAEALADCLRRYTSQSCAEARESGGLQSAYRMCAFVKGLVAEGGVCQDQLECVDGYCLKPADAAPAAEGACAARKPDGADCRESDECQGRRCASGSCTQAEIEGLCARPMAP
jgi:hypothetical protein